jgi:endonuclease/exonuclease/phosphatase (EEP) superfamily protein YafD
MSRSLSNNLIQYILIVVLFLGVVECIFVPSYFAYVWARQFAIQLVFVYLGLAILFMVIKLQRLMLVSFLCCATICLYLKLVSNQLLIQDFAEGDKPTYTVALLNLSISPTEVGEVFAKLDQINADVISVEELSTFWSDTLSQVFKRKYPYQNLLANYNALGIGFFSKYPIVAADTFYFESVPNLAVTILNNNFKMPMHLISTRTEPPYSNSTYRRLGKHLDLLSDKVNSYDGMTISVGNLNVVTWSDEVIGFLAATHMLDSRRGFMTTYPRAPFTLTTLPTDHIFYTRDYKCVFFNNLTTSSEHHFGLYAAFQKNNTANEKAD